MTLKTPWRLATGGAAAGAATAAVGLLIFACVFLAVAGPREGIALRTHALQQSLRAQQPMQRTVYASLNDTALDARLNVSSTSTATLLTVQSELRRNLTSSHLPLAASGTDWYGMTTALGTLSGYSKAAAPAGVAPLLELVYRGQLSRYATLVSGTLPATATQGANGTTLQIAVTTGTAATLHLHAGSRLGDGLGTTLVVTGIVRAGAPSTPFWAADPLVYAPAQEELPPPSNAPYWTGAGFVGAGELAVLQKTMDPATTIIGWDFPLDLSGVTAGGAAALSGEFAQAATVAGLVGNSGGGIRGLAGSSPVTITAGVSGTVTGFIAQDTTAGAVLSLLSVSLAAVGIMVIVAGAQLIAEQRRDEFALRRARGGARWQIGLLALAGMAAVTIPAAAGAIALAVTVTAGYPDPLTWWLAGGTVLAALGGAPVIAVRAHRGITLPGLTRLAPRPRRAALRRLSAEAMLVVLAVGGLILLRQQGLGQQGLGQQGTGAAGWYTSLAPVLVAVPAAIVVVRCYPLLLRALLRVARGRPGVTAFVGFSRAVQNTPRAALPAFTLVLALTVVAFGTMVRSAVTSGEVAASWQRTGADALIDAGTSQRPLTPAAERAIAAVPGVQHAAPVVVLYDSEHGDAFALVAVNPAQYGALVGSTPGGAFPAAALSGHGAAIPALASPGYTALLGGTSGQLHTSEGTLSIHVTGSVRSVPGIPGGGTLLVIPASALPVPVAPLEDLITGPHLDARALRQVVGARLPGATVTLRRDVLASLTGAPLPHSDYLAITVGSVAAGALVVLVLLITLVLAARDGASILARLRVMGLGRGQARRLEIAHMLPQVAVSAAGGLACAYALAPLIGPSIDLSAFIGDTAAGAGSAVPVRAQPVPLLVAAAGLLLLAMATVAVQNVITAGREQP